MGGFSLFHILIFAVIVLLLFGGNRFSAMMGDVAKGLKSFKAGMSDEDEARLEALQALGDVAHHRREAIAAKQQQHDDRENQDMKEAETAHDDTPKGKASPF